jgi:hypothetical protein
VDTNLRLADPERLSFSDSLSNAANIALIFEFGVNCAGEVGLDSLAGEEPLDEAMVASIVGYICVKVMQTTHKEDQVLI